MTLFNADDAAIGAVLFWERELGSVTPDLEEWLTERCGDVHLLWGDIRRLTRSKQMWHEVSDVLEERDSTNAWTRNYDDLYWEAQIVRLRRVYEGDVSLLTFLRDFERRPELCATLTQSFMADELRRSVDPIIDRQALGRQLAPLRNWRNQRIAHIDRHADLDDDLRLHDLDVMVDGVTEVFGRYAFRIAGANYQTEIPDTPGWTDWKKAFAEPLFPAGNEGTSAGN